MTFHDETPALDIDRFNQSLPYRKVTNIVIMKRKPRLSAVQRKENKLHLNNFTFAMTVLVLQSKYDIDNYFDMKK